jgi:WD40 repeat protein
MSSNVFTNKLTYSGHDSSITSIAISYHSSYFISGDSSGTIRLWDLMSGVCIAVYQAHIRMIWKVTMCPKGYYFASVCSNSIIYLWSSNNPVPLKQFSFHSKEVTCLEFSKNLLYLVSASYDKSIRVYSIDDQDQIRILYSKEPVLALSINEIG